MVQTLDESQSPSAVMDLAFSPGGDWVATARISGMVVLHHLESHQEVALRHSKPGEFPWNKGVMAIAFNHDGSLLVSSGTDGRLVLWELDSRSEINSFSSGDVPSPWVGFVGGGSQVLAAPGWGPMRLWEQIRGDRFREWKNHRGSVLEVAYSPDGGWVASIGKVDGTVRVFDAETGEEWVNVHQYGTTSSARSIAFGPEGARLFVLSREQPTLRVIEIPTGGLLESYRLTDLLQESDLEVSEFGGMVMSSAGRYLAIRNGRRVVVLEAPSWSPLKEMAMRSAPVRDLAFSPGAKWLAISMPSKVLLEAIDNHRAPIVLTDQGRDFQGIAFSSDGSLLAVAARGAIQLWQTVEGNFEGATSRLLSNQRTTDFRFLTVSFHPDGDRLVTSYLPGNQFMIWDVAYDLGINQYLVGEGNSGRALFSPDGRTIASIETIASENQPGVIRLWDAKRFDSATEREQQRVAQATQWVQEAFEREGFSQLVIEKRSRRRALILPLKPLPKISRLGEGIIVTSWHA